MEDSDLIRFWKDRLRSGIATITALLATLMMIVAPATSAGDTSTSGLAFAPTQVATASENSTSPEALLVSREIGMAATVSTATAQSLVLADQMGTTPVVTEAEQAVMGAPAAKLTAVSFVQFNTIGASVQVSDDSAPTALDVSPRYQVGGASLTTGGRPDLGVSKAATNKANGKKQAQEDHPKTG